MAVRVPALLAAVGLILGGLVAATLVPESWPQILAFVGPTLTTLGVLLQVQNHDAHLNSRMDQLLDLTARASRAEGVKEEHERARQQEG